MVRNLSRALFHSPASVSMALAGVLVAPFLCATAVWAQEISPPPAAPSPGAAQESSITPVQPPEWGGTFHHQGQVGLSLMPGGGYRMIVPYKDEVYCGDEENDGRRVCTSRSPTFVDLELSFGITTKVDLLVATRFGLEKDFTRSRQFALMPGLRVWLDQDESLKFYTTVQVVYDRSDQRGQVSNTDYGARVALGLMYDPIRNVGFFTQLGATSGFTRWFRLEADLGVGVQVRLP